MTPADLARATADYDLHRRALAACTVAEPHLDDDDAPPCSRHLLDAARQLALPAHHVSAPALASIDAAPQPGAEGASGVTGVRVSGPPPCQDAGGSIQQSNRPPAQNEGPAECGPVRPRKQV